MSRQLVRLRLPADPSYGRLARIAAAGLARRQGFDHHRVQDLRIAVDEAMVSLLDPSGDAAELELRFQVGGDQMTVEAQALGGDARLPTEEASARLVHLVEGLVDNLVVDPARRQVTITTALP